MPTKKTEKPTKKIEKFKKLFISQPMNGKTEDDILKARSKVAAKMEKKGYKVVDSYFKDGPVNDPLYYLGKSIQLMGKCDTVYFCKDWQKCNGCMIEFEVAVRYGKEIIFE